MKRPKFYGFDTGFVTYVRGWKDIRDDDRGLLWEHLVLDTLRAETGGEGLYHWRDKSGREVDFVVRRGRVADAVECKVNPDSFDPASLAVFREAYPRGRNFLVCPGIQGAYDRRFGELAVRVVGARDLLTEPAGPASFLKK